MKSGDYLSSRRLTASTFGVRKLNFCVRNGNRWDLSAIITAMAIYLVAYRNVTYTNFSWSLLRFPPFFKTVIFFLEDLQLHSNYFYEKPKSFLPLKLVKIIEIFVKKLRKNSLSLNILRSSPRPISIGQLYITAFTPPTYQPYCL